jgi:hypothetical protein
MFAIMVKDVFVGSNNMAWNVTKDADGEMCADCKICVLMGV